MPSSTMHGLVRSSTALYVPTSHLTPRVRQTFAASCLPSLVSYTVLAGPVASSLTLFVIEKAVKRLVAGQILRKGVLRKIRRLAILLGTWDVFHMVLNEFLENLQ